MVRLKCTVQTDSRGGFYLSTTAITLHSWLHCNVKAIRTIVKRWADFLTPRRVIYSESRQLADTDRLLELRSVSNWRYIESKCAEEGGAVNRIARQYGFMAEIVLCERETLRQACWKAKQKGMQRVRGS